MSTTAVPLTAPHYQKKVSLVIGDPDTTAYEFAEALEELAIIPSTSLQSWVGIGGVSLTDVEPPSWSVQAKYVQDFETTTSLANYLHAHPGEVVDVAFKPKATGGKIVRAKCVLVPGQIGGAKGLATSTVTWGVQGTPTIEDDEA